VVGDPTCNKVVRLLWKAVYGRQRRQWVKNKQYRHLVRLWQLDQAAGGRGADEDNGSDAEDEEDELFTMSPAERKELEQAIGDRFDWCVRSLTLRRMLDPRWKAADVPCNVCRERIYESQGYQPVPLRARSRPRCEANVRLAW
jgi:hypothetical protein